MVTNTPPWRTPQWTAILSCMRVPFHFKPKCAWPYRYLRTKIIENFTPFTEGEYKAWLWTMLSNSLEMSLKRNELAHFVERLDVEHSPVPCGHVSNLFLAWTQTDFLHIMHSHWLTEVEHVQKSCLAYPWLQWDDKKNKQSAFQYWYNSSREETVRNYRTNQTHLKRQRQMKNQFFGIRPNIFNRNRIYIIWFWFEPLNWLNVKVMWNG